MLADIINYHNEEDREMIIDDNIERKKSNTSYINLIGAKGPSVTVSRIADD